MTKTIHGRIHGKTIELDEDLGVAEGQEVEVQVTVVQPAGKWGEGILRTAGALANDTEWDGIMEQIYQDRKLNWSPQRDFLRCGGQARTVSPVDVTAVRGSQPTYRVEVAAELLADVEEQTVRSVHQAQRPR